MKKKCLSFIPQFFLHKNIKICAVILILTGLLTCNANIPFALTFGNCAGWKALFLAWNNHLHRLTDMCWSVSGSDNAITKQLDINVSIWRARYVFVCLFLIVVGIINRDTENYLKVNLLHNRTWDATAGYRVAKRYLRICSAS